MFDPSTHPIDTAHDRPHDTAFPTSTPTLARFDWLGAAAQLPGKTLHLALMLSWLSSQRRTACVRPGRRAMRRFQISRDACYDGLRRLEAAQLIHMWRLPGRTPQVILREPTTGQPLRVT